MKRQHLDGFTLIEVLLAMAITGIIGAIAYPSYTMSLLRGQRAQGRTAIVELAQQQEQYIPQKGCYLAFNTDLAGIATPLAPSPSTDCGGLAATSAPFKTFSGDSIISSAYLMSAEACPGSGGSAAVSTTECIRILATPLKSDPEVNVLRMTSTGTRDCTGTASASKPTLCWP